MSENILIQNFEEEMSNSFLEYSMEVITNRALPAVEDGLKPVHRRILFDMIENMRLKSNKTYVKSAKVVGSVIGVLHPHGDASVYDAACNLVTNHTMRYPLIDGQGSFGSPDGSGAAAMRYTEMRPGKLAELMLEDYNKNAVDKKMNFSEEEYEPVVLPGLFPQILCNPTMGISVGMAANFASHNLTEVCNGIIAYLNNKDIDTKGLMEYIPGPDFPLGGVIINQKDIFEAYDTGRSAVTLKIRGEYTVKGKEITFTSLPYGTTTEKIIAQINKYVDQFAMYFSDFRDDTNAKNGIKIVFTLADEEFLEPGLGLIFSKTDLQDTFSINQNCIVKGSPKVLSLKELIKFYVEHQIDVIKRTTQFDLDKNEAKLHILEGLIIALENIDEVIELIKKSYNKKEAKQSLITKYNLDDIQTEEILNTKLSKLTSLEIEDLKSQIKDLKEEIAKLKELLGSSEKQEKLLISKVENMKNKYGDTRRTKLTSIEVTKAEKIKQEIPSTPVIVSLNKMGYLKRSNVNQKDAINIKINQNETLIVFDDNNMAHKLKVNDLETIYKAPNNFLKDCKEIIGIANLKDCEEFLLVTKNGQIKKTKSEDFSSSRAVATIKLREGDSLVYIAPVTDEITLYTSSGKGLSFSTKEFNATGRATLGLKALSLKEGEFITKVVKGSAADVESGKRAGVPKSLKKGK